MLYYVRITVKYKIRLFFRWIGCAASGLCLIPHPTARLVIGISRGSELSAMPPQAWRTSAKSPDNVRLPIYRERLQAGLNDFFPNTGLDRKVGDFGGRRLAEPERFFHALRRMRKAGRRVVEHFLVRGALEKIDDGFGRRIDANRDALNRVALNAFVEDVVSEALNLDSRLRNLWAPVAGTDRHPYESWNAVRELVKGESGDLTDDPIGHQFRGDGERVISVKRRVGELVESAAEVIENALLLHARNGGRGDALLDKFRQTHHAPLLKERCCAVFLPWVFRFHGTYMIQNLANV